MEDKIPKIVHYCWFGKGTMDKLTRHCLQSWKNVLPDYEFKLWNKSNFKVDFCEYTSQAYRIKKWAFVSDYVRLYALYKYGGIYLDTDVEVLKNFDEFLSNDAFLGFENNVFLSSGIIGSCKEGKLIKRMIEYYNTRAFNDRERKISLITNNILITRLLKKSGLILNGSYQVIDGDISVYPADYFSPKSYISNKIKLTPNSHCIHHFAESWVDDKNGREIKKRTAAIIGENNFYKLFYKKSSMKLRFS